MASLKSELFVEVAEEQKIKSNNKVTIVGIGAVGMAAAFSILAQVRNHVFEILRHINEILFPHLECFRGSRFS